MVIVDVPTAANAVENFQKQMMRRFKFMEEQQVNNIYKIKDKEVDYYEVLLNASLYSDMQNN